MPSHSLETYLQAAQRGNTQRSYASAVRHFEVTWGGLLPATMESVAKYLVAHATSLSINTLRQRLAALAQWANTNGWDVRALMEYVGWKDVHSAMRYIDAPDAFGQQRIEAALATVSIANAAKIG